MTKILGLYLGVNSIGWAILDTKSSSILSLGTRVFPVGVNNLGDGAAELSRNAIRTQNRRIRKQFFRKRLRKKILLKELVNQKMCPLTSKDIDNWNTTKQFPSQELSSWFAINPYENRHKALSEKVPLESIGRIFYHLIQRRGYLSNSRIIPSDDGHIFNGNSKNNTIGINETRAQIESTTLGSYLYEIHPKQNVSFENGLERIRNRYTTRQMYIDEFEQIWEHQKNYHPELSLELKEKFGGRKNDGFNENGILFHQRPLKSKKHLVGNCSFEKKKKKAHLSSISYENFSIYKWINSVEYNGIKLNETERHKIAHFLCFKEKPFFKEIRKVIDKLDPFYKFNQKDQDKICVANTIPNLSSSKYFGKKWLEFSDKEQDDIWHILYFFGDKDKLENYAIEKWGFTPIQAQQISNFNLKPGYANICRKAMNNIFPFLKMGCQYELAVVLGGIKNAFANYWENLDEVKKAIIIDQVSELYYSNFKSGLDDILVEYLKTELQFDSEQITKLYQISVFENINDKSEKLEFGSSADKKINNLRNPVFSNVLFEIRKLINKLSNEYGNLNEIKVALSPNLKASKSGRYEFKKKQLNLQKETNQIKDELKSKGFKTTNNNVMLFKLWKECKETCPYTGNNISINQLFSDDIEVEYIHAWCKSLNDSFINKTLCFSDEKISKGEKIPYEFYNSQGEEKWNEVKNRALNLFSDYSQNPDGYRKFKRFIQKKFDDDFINKNLNDTKYISKSTKEYLLNSCSKVTITNSKITTNLKNKWGLNLFSSNDYLQQAIEALIVANVSVNQIQELSKWNRYDINSPKFSYPLPWKNFIYDVELALKTIVVSHKNVNKTITVQSGSNQKDGFRGISARGQLHKETIFGLRNLNGIQAFHIRKPVESLKTETQIDKIVDPTIKKIILKRVIELGGFIKGIVPENTYFSEDDFGVKQPKLFLPNKKGISIPIMKVRIKESFRRAEQLKKGVNQYVNPRNNHHALVYRDKFGSLKDDVVSFWSVVERKRCFENDIKLPEDGLEIICSLQINNTFLLGLKDENIDWDNLDYKIITQHLYRVQKTSKKENSFEFIFRHANAATLDNKDQEISIQSFKKWIDLNPIKVRVSVIGKIEKFNL